MFSYYDMFVRELKNRNHSLMTIKIYGNKIKQYLKFHEQNKIILKDKSINDKTSIFIEKQNGYVARRQAYSAIKLYFKYVLKKDCPYFLDKVKKRLRLPAILSKEEILTILSHIKNPVHYLIIAMLYGGGLRVSPLFSQNLRLKRRRFCSDKDLRLNETRSIVALCENRVQE